MHHRLHVSFCGTCTLAMIIVTIVVPIVLIDRLNKLNLGGATGTEGQPIFLAENQTITLSGQATTTQMTVYRWDWDEKNKTMGNLQNGLNICFQTNTGKGVVAYLSHGARPPTPDSWSARMYATGTYDLFLTCFSPVDSTNCGGSLYIGIMANSTYASLNQQGFSLQVTRQTSTWCDFGKGVLVALGMMGVIFLAIGLGCVACCCCAGFGVIYSNYRKRSHVHYTRIDVYSPVVNAVPNNNPVVYYQQPPAQQQQQPLLQPAPQYVASYPVQQQQQPPPYSTPLVNRID